MVIWHDNPPGWKRLAAGGSGALYYSPENPAEVIKIPSNKDHSVKAIETEKRIYERLGSHPNIVSVTRIEEKGIFLKRAKYGSLRQYLRTSTATMEERIRWCRDVAIALHYVHSRGVKQVDIGMYFSALCKLSTKTNN
jgi:serine/threonine protein kinase